MSEWSDKFEDTKGVIRSLWIEEEQSIQLQKENGKKNTNNDLENTRKQNIEQQQTNGVNSGFLKRKAVPAPLVAPTVLSIRLDYKNATQRVSPVQEQI